MKDRFVFQHKNDVDCKGRKAKITISSRYSWVQTRVHELFNHNAILQLWNNCKMPDGRHIGSNKCEHANSFKKSMSKCLKTFTHKFWKLLRLVFIFAYNKSSLKFLLNNTELFYIIDTKWLNELSIFFDKVFSFDHLNSACDEYYIVGNYSLDFVENNKYDMDYVKSHNLIKKIKHNNKWNLYDQMYLNQWFEMNYDETTVLTDQIVKKCKQYFDKRFSGDTLFYKLRYFFKDIDCNTYPHQPHKYIRTSILSDKIEYTSPLISLKLHWKRAELLKLLDTFYNQYNKSIMKKAWKRFVLICTKQKIGVSRDACSIYDLTKKQIIYFAQITICSECSTPVADEQCSECSNWFHSHHLYVHNCCNV